MEQKKDILFRNQLALASLFFFRPLTKGMIAKNGFNLSNDDKSFVEGYIKIGLLSSVLLLIYIIIVFSKYYFRESILDPISKILIIIVLAVIVLGIVGIFSNVNIGPKLAQDIKNTDKKNLFLTYLPIINLYSRYNNHSFDKPDYINKESIILWSLFTILLATGNLFTIAILLMFIIVRFISLSMGIEFINTNFKNKISGLFYTNPEEIRGNISGTIKYFFKNKSNVNSIASFIEDEKSEYRKLYSTKDILHIKIQYTLLLILLGVLIYFNIGNTNILIFTGLVLGRYILMQVKWKHLPSIPVIKEIVFGLIKIYNKFTSKPNK